MRALDKKALFYFLLLVAVILGLGQLIPLPYKTFEEFVALLRELYARWGYWVVFLGSIIEGLLVIGWYFPGSAMVLLAAIFSREGVLSFPIVAILAISAFFISYNINYFLGKYGWYRLLKKLGAEIGIREAKERIEKYRGRAIFAGFVTPGLAVVFSTAAGILQFPYPHFLFWSFASVTFWVLLWGTLAYFLGLPLLHFVTRYWWTWTGAILLYLLYKVSKKEKS